MAVKTPALGGIELAWRRLMATLGRDHPNLVNRNRIIVKTIRARMRSK